MEAGKINEQKKLAKHFEMGKNCDGYMGLNARSLIYEAVLGSD